MPSYIPAHRLLLVPLNCTPDPVLPPSHLRLIPPGSTVKLEESGSDPEAQSCWNSCPIPRHTHTHRKPLLSASQTAPPNVRCLPSARTPTPPWGPGLALCLGPEGCPLQLPLYTKPALWSASPNSGDYDKSAPPPCPPGRHRTEHRGHREKRAQRWCLPKEVPADRRAPAPPGAPRPAGGRPPPTSPPLFSPEAPARSRSVLTMSTRRARLGSGGQLAPASPVRTDTAPGRAPRPPLRPQSQPPGGSRPAATARRPPCRRAPGPAPNRAAPPGPALAPPGPALAPPQSGSLRPLAPPRAPPPARPPRPAPPLAPPQPGPPRPRLLPSHGPGQVRHRPARPSVSPPAAPKEEVHGRKEDPRGGRPKSGSLRGERAAGFTAPRLEGPRPTRLRTAESLGNCLLPGPHLEGFWSVGARAALPLGSGGAGGRQCPLRGRLRRRSDPGFPAGVRGLVLGNSHFLGTLHSPRRPPGWRRPLVASPPSCLLYC